MRLCAFFFFFDDIAVRQSSDQLDALAGSRPSPLRANRQPQATTKRKSEGRVPCRLGGMAADQNVNDSFVWGVGLKGSELRSFYNLPQTRQKKSSPVQVLRRGNPPPHPGPTTPCFTLLAMGFEPMRPKPAVLKTAPLD